MGALHDSLEKWADWHQFVLVKGKIPVGPDLRAVDPHQPTNWMSAPDAYARAELLGCGVGFVFTTSDPFWFLDIDHCIDEQGHFSPIAQQLMGSFAGAAVEISASGTGVHIFGCGSAPEHSKKNTEHGIEFYTEGRFVLLTGDRAAGNVWLDWTPQLRWLVDTHFPQRLQGDSVDWRDEPVPEWSGPEDDQVLIGKMLGSRGSAASVMGGRATVRDLFDGNTEVLARTYPSQNDYDPYDRSSADAALAQHLAFWTGKNHERVRRIMYQSALYREKWENHPTYVEMTVVNAVNGCGDVYKSRPTEATVSPALVGAAPVGVEPSLTDGAQFMSAHQQIEYFKGCVYIKRTHTVLTPNGGMLRPDQFKASYGGYTFSMDQQNERTTRNAWEAFVENQAVRFPKVDGICFRPRLDPLAIINEEGFTLVNSYKPIQMPRAKGDTSRFLEHMRKLFPVPSDLAVILAYMAAVVQHQGIKFQWCPIIQGAEGNGKTLISRVIENSVGSRYTHYPNASDLAGGGLKFNGWIEGKVFIGLEEIFVSDRRELTEPMKVFVTNDRMEIQHKGMGQFTGDNIANIVMYSNHKDCMKITYDQRRYFMVFTAQQSADDLYRDGMTNKYFKDLYDWLKHEGGYAVVCDYLWSYEIPDELNPAGLCQRAPQSSSLDEAVQHSLGMVEQHIQESIETNRPGFCGGYISSKALSDLLSEIKMDTKVSLQKRATILEGMGFVKHPWLSKGRTDNPVMAEGVKPVLYIRKDLAHGTPQSGSWVKKDYESKQGYPGNGVLGVVT